MTSHVTIHTGAGWRCKRCGVSWDQGEEAPEACASLETFVGKAADAVVEFADKIGLTGETFTRGSGDRFHSGGVVKGGDGLRVGEIPAALSPSGFRSIPMGGYHTLAPNSVTISHKDAEEYLADTGQPRDPMKRQVGGMHYRDFPIQPTEFAQKNGYDACSFSILKYLARYRTKNGVEDLRKARHYVEIREAIGVFNIVGTVISMAEFLVRNRIPTADLQSFVRLDAYLRCPIGSTRTISAAALIKEIDALIAAALLTS